VSGFPKDVRDIVIARANGTCERCGFAAPAYQIHHRRPRGAGGSTAADTNTASNALCVCISCHGAIEANRSDALEHGWLVRQGQNPCGIRVLRLNTWVTLDDFGYVTPTEGAA
jgi:5-methylcytosine-specific restriction protein A